MRYSIYMLLLVMSVAGLSKAWSKTAVVVAKDSLVVALDRQSVSNIFLGRTSRFPNGEKAIPIEVKGNNVREYFYQNISGKTPAQLNSYWTTLVFTGKGKPPKRFSSQDAVLAKLESAPGTITYLPSDEVTDNMKVLYVFE